MHSQDRIKLRKAGFRIFRMRTDGPTGARYSIWDYDGSWKKHSAYKTAAAMRDAWQELMADNLNIGDEP